MSKLTKYTDFKPASRRILEAEDIDPAEPMTIKWVADLTDASTRSVGKYIWENMTTEQRQSKLNEMSASERLIGKSFDELGTEVQSKIITGFQKVDVQKELE